MESVLLAAARSGRVPLPYVTVDFSETEVADIHEITSLEAPHRIYDAILRDSLIDETVFRLSPPGTAITEASAGNAFALFRYAPTALLFGGWDSTGPKGGLGSKIERALTSELIGINVELGVKVGSRIDPLGIQNQAGPLYQAKEGVGLKWTTDIDEAVVKMGTPVLFDQNQGEGKAGNPSKVNHANIVPTIESASGGVTVDEVRATSVLSFIQLRRIGFPVNDQGDALEPEERQEVEAAARTALAALGILAIVLAFEEGYDLRSRCVLVADGPLELELIGRASQVQSFELTGEAAIALFQEAVEAAREAGLPWDAEPLKLLPAPQLVDLVQRSRERVVDMGPEDD